MSLDAEGEGGSLTRTVTDALLLLETKLFFSFVQEGSSHQTRESHLKERMNGSLTVAAVAGGQTLYTYPIPMLFIYFIYFLADEEG